LYRFTALYAEHLKPLPEIIEIAHQVQKSYVIVAVSDGDFGSMYAIDMLETHYGVRFQKRFESWRQGVKKPVLYMDALNYLKSLYTIHTDEIICIDDIEEYIKFANQIKMQGIVFDGTKEHSDQLRWRLKEAGLELSMANE
jgi:beta-phosphoglucomutase-like phosphatase (HAD superfamily)